MLRKIKAKINLLKNKFNEKKRNIREVLKNSYYVFFYSHAKLNSNVAFIESRTGEDFAGNMFRIAQGLQKRNIKLYIAVKKGSENKVSRLVRLACTFRLI